MIVNPYDMYCDSTLKFFKKIPQWCLAKIPDIYGYVQKTYWNAGFLQFYKRPGWIGEFLKAGPTNLFSLYLIFTCLKKIGLKTFLTLGIFKTETYPDEHDIEDSPIITPLLWQYVLTFLLVFFSAN